MTIKDSLHVKISYGQFLVEKFLSHIFGQIFTFLGNFWGLNISIKFFNPQKAHSCVRPRLLCYRALKSVQGSDM